MWLWRAGNLSRWRKQQALNTEHVARAARDLSLRAGEQGLSLYLVENPSEIERVCLLFAITLRGRPRDLEYLLINRQCFDVIPSLQLLKIPVEGLHPELSERHYEARGLTPEIALQLAEIILTRPDCEFRVLAEKRVMELAKTLVKDDPTVTPFLIGEWPSRLETA